MSASAHLAKSAQAGQLALPAHWRRAGDPALPALLLLHGFLGSSADWAALIPGLTDFACCLAPDLPGHGSNPSDDCRFDAMAEQILKSLHTAGITRFTVLGYSMGARLALYLLSRYPDRALAGILESGSPGLDEEGARAARRDQDERLARQLESMPLGDFLARWYEQPLFAGLKQSAGFATLLARRLNNDPSRLARSLREAGTGTAPSSWQALASLRQPMLCLVGEQDAKFRAIGAQMDRQCPALRLQTLPGGHCPHAEAPDAWLAQVRAFLAGQDAFQGPQGR